MSMNDTTSSRSLDLSHPEKNLRDRINAGILFCDGLYRKGEGCTRLINKYKCETCDENKPIMCKAWRRMIELEKTYYIIQIIKILRRHVEILLLYEPIKKEKTSERWTKHKPEMEQQTLFKGK